MSGTTSHDTHQASQNARKSAEGGMTEDDAFIRGGQIAAMFCIGFAFLAPCLMLWRVVF